MTAIQSRKVFVNEVQKYADLLDKAKELEDLVASTGVSSSPSMDDYLAAIDAEDRQASKIRLLAAQLAGFDGIIWRSLIKCAWDYADRGYRDNLEEHINQVFDGQ